MTGDLLFFRNTSITNTDVELLSTTSSADVTIRAFNIININTYPVYLKFYNLSGTNTVVGTSTPTGILMIPANGSIYDNITEGSPDTGTGGRYLNFNTALTIACTKNLADNDNTTPATGIYVELQYQKII